MYCDQIEINYLTYKKKGRMRNEETFCSDALKIKHFIYSLGNAIREVNRSLKLQG